MSGIEPHVQESTERDFVGIVSPRVGDEYVLASYKNEHELNVTHWKQHNAISWKAVNNAAHLAVQRKSGANIRFTKGLDSLCLQVNSNWWEAIRILRVNVALAKVPT